MVMNLKCPFKQGMLCDYHECALFIGPPPGKEDGICAITQMVISLTQGREEVRHDIEARIEDLERRVEALDDKLN